MKWETIDESLTGAKTQCQWCGEKIEEKNFLIYGNCCYICSGIIGRMAMNESSPKFLTHEKGDRMIRERGIINGFIK